MFYFVFHDKYVVTSESTFVCFKGDGIVLKETLRSLNRDFMVMKTLQGEMERAERERVDNLEATS